MYRRKLVEWVACLEGRNQSSETIDSYEKGVRYAWRFGLKNGWPKHPKKIQPKHVKAYLEDLKRLSSKTQYTYATPLILFLKWCGNTQFKEFKIRIKPERSKVDWLTVEEAIDILASAPTMWVRAMETALMYTGIRVSELANLRLSDVHDDNIMVVGKGGKVRKIPVSLEFWEAMGPYMTWRRGRGEHVSFLIHPKRGGRPEGPYSAGSIQNAIAEHSRSFGRHFSAHTFRRSFGRHLYRAGMQLIEIQRLYGHSSSDMTTRYLGITEEDLSASLSRFQPSYKRPNAESVKE